MMLESIEASELAIPFKGAFKHAAAERHATQSLWVRAHAASGETGFGEGCPREYVTAESLGTALSFRLAKLGLAKPAIFQRGAAQ